MKNLIFCGGRLLMSYYDDSTKSYEIIAFDLTLVFRVRVHYP